MRKIANGSTQIRNSPLSGKIYIQIISGQNFYNESGTPCDSFVRVTPSRDEASSHDTEIILQNDNP